MKRLQQLLGRGHETQDVPAPSPLAREGWHPTHRHKKGGYYRLITYGIAEADERAVAIYDDAVGTVWVRCAKEFDDGRFTPMSASNLETDPQ